MQALARYWATEYDWRKIEAKLNALPQFITEIDGLDIHFIHVRSKHENALPFPDELNPAPRSWAEKAYPKLIHFKKLTKGGHFAAWEQPKLFSEEVRAGFRSLR
jgi:pimeloyl-ACP methyl ester carboxylesterase